MIPDEVGRQLRRLGHDVLGVQEPEQHWARGLDDAAQLEVASREGRVFVSFNVSDFILLSREWAEAQRRHAGILLIHHRTISQDDIGGIVRSLARILDVYRGEDALADQVLFVT
jgi:hypothetical protein